MLKGLLVGTLFFTLLLTSGLSQNDKPMDQNTMMQLNAPGAMHKNLEKLVGKWNQEISIIPTPGMNPMKGKVVANHQMIYGGRFLQMEGEVEFMGMKGHALTIMGHNNRTKKFSFYNIADVGTDATIAKGTFDEEKQQFILHGSNLDPITGGSRKFRIVITLIDQNHFKQENFFQSEGQEEFKGVEVVSSRVK